MRTHQHIVTAIDSYVQRLCTQDAPEVDLDRLWHDLHARGTAGPPDLVAEAIDMLDTAASFDPVPLLRQDHRDILRHPDLLFPSGVGPARVVPRLPQHAAAEYAKVALRALRCGKFAVTASPMAGGGISSTRERR